MKKLLSRDLLIALVLLLVPMAVLAQTTGDGTGGTGGGVFGFGGGLSKDDVANALYNLMQSYPGIFQLINAASYVIGAFLIVSAIYKLKRYGEARTMMMTQVHAMGPMLMLFVGLMLFYLPLVTQLTANTLWGVQSIKQYPSDASVNWKYYIDPVIGLVRIVGYIAFIRGWLLLLRLGTEQPQPGVASKALLHILGGILAINIVGTVTILKNTLIG